MPEERSDDGEPSGRWAAALPTEKLAKELRAALSGAGPIGYHFER
jgi:hypothetical protein